MTRIIGATVILLLFAVAARPAGGRVLLAQTGSDTQTGEEGIATNPSQNAAMTGETGNSYSNSYGLASASEGQGQGNGNGNGNGNGGGRTGGCPANCKTCVLVPKRPALCRACKDGYTPSDNATSCVCQPGYFFNDAGVCVQCINAPAGPYTSWCAGGEEPPVACGPGMTTKSPAAMNPQLCITVPGWGLGPNGSAVECPIGTYASGNARKPCTACGKGLTTRGTASNGTSACAAPPGFYMNRGVGMPCPKGTFMATLSYSSQCAPCDKGLTTTDTASTGAEQCTHAKPGYFVQPRSGNTSGTSPVVALPCPKGTHNSGNNTLSACRPCPAGTTTTSSASTSQVACQAPKGWGFNKTTQTASPCPQGTFKSSFSRAGCSSCGKGFLTNSTATQAFSGCYVPAGYGTVPSTTSPTGWAAVKCVNGYGVGVLTFGVKKVACSPCPANMMTLDALSPEQAAQAGFSETNLTAPRTSILDCLLTPGYQLNPESGVAEPCPIGTYSSGYSRDSTCTHCGEGLTTEQEGSKSGSACVLAPGFEWSADRTTPLPCAAGEYGPGGNSSCLLCPAGTTTTADGQSGRISDCDACSAGFGLWTSVGGIPSCSLCPSGSWSPGGTPDACTRCPAGKTISAPGADNSGECAASLQDMPTNVDYIPAAPEALTPAPLAAASEADCAAQCDAADPPCMFYQYGSPDASAPPLCQLAIAGSSSPGGADGSARQVAFKVSQHTYSVFAAPSAPAATVGSPLRDSFVAAAGVIECSQACDALASCLLISLAPDGSSGGGVTCQLLGGDLDVHLTSKYRVTPESIRAWSASSPTAVPAIAAAGDPHDPAWDLQPRRQMLG